ncbi:MAG: tyrosine-type recombinase/integrase [Planctomycetes bacterium]|nr:tyrosine-type recombinase/integrase [Planctomycetota bacterium]
MHKDLDSWTASLVARAYADGSVTLYRQKALEFVDWLAQQEVTTARQITLAHMEGFFGRLRERGLSAGTLHTFSAAILSFMRWLVAHGRIRRAPGVPRFRRQGKKLPRVLTTDQIEGMLAACDGDAFLAVRDRAIIEVLYSTGARASELCGLTTGAIDTNRGVVIVHGKGGKDRVVMIGEPARDALVAWLRLRRVIHGVSTDALFLTQGGTGLAQRHLAKTVTTRAHRAGIPIRVSPHVLRHSFATHMIERRADPCSVQALLGHASLSTTQIYVHLSARHVAETFVSTHPRALRRDPPCEQPRAS